MDTLFRKACSLFIVGVPGRELDSESRLLVENGAGVILFSRNLSDWREGFELVRQVHDCARPRKPLVCIDQEGGRVQRLGPPFIQLPPMEVLGRRGDPSLCRRLARQLGAELRAAGTWLDFAPVLDCNTNPANPVIGDRSFGDDPALVAK
ncbi:MAG: glycoside hydrolase family 3 protein, partial [Deltaproteobacteria bacterium]